jgi:hypothetical protein
MINTRDNLLPAIELDIVTFTFTKANGSSRIAEGTRNLDIIPVLQHPKGTSTKAKAEGILVFFDWGKQQWRSCKLSSIFGSWKITKEHALVREIADKAKLF